MSVDMFKSLIFMHGLTAAKDKDIRSRILTTTEQNSDITLQKVSEECQRLINMKRDIVSIEEKNISRVQTIKPQKFAKGKAKPSPCDGCDGVTL